MSDRQTVVLIVTGKRRSTKGTTIWSYVREDTGEEVYLGKRIGAGSIGTRYEVEHEAPGTFYPNSARHLGRVEHDDDRLGKWVAEDEAASQEEAKARVERKASQVEPLDDLVKTISAMSANLNRAERRALATRLMEALWL